MKRFFPIVVPLFLISNFVFAETYIHGSVGEADFSSGGNPDMYEFGLGFGLSSSLSLEFSYVNLGTVDTGLGGGDFIEEEADGFNTALVADIPLNDTLALYLSVGNLRWEDTARYFEGGVYVDNFTVTDNDWNFGAGIKAEVFDGLELKFGYTEYDLDDIEVESISAGIVYRF